MFLYRLTPLIIVLLLIGSITLAHNQIKLKAILNTNHLTNLLIKVFVITLGIACLLNFINIFSFPLLNWIAVTFAIIAGWIINLLFMTLPYRYYLNQSQSNWVNFLLIANLIANAMCFILLADELIVHPFENIILTSFSVLFLNFICHLMIFIPFKIYSALKGVLSPISHDSSQKESETPKMMSHYYDKGLSNEEIRQFREEIKPARQMIIDLETAFNQSAKLKAINLRNNTVLICQDYFKSIVNEPERIHDAGTFLFKLLPNLHDMIAKYNELNQHIAKNKNTYLILDKCAEMVERVCQSIHQDYIDFHQSTYDSIDEEIRYAEQITKEKPHYTSDDDRINHLLAELDATINEDKGDDFNDF